MSGLRVTDVYKSLGVVFVDEVGDQFVADCPFTGKPRKLYVNKTDGRWILHSAEGGSGNVYTFLDRFVAHWRDETTALHWNRLAVLRGLPVAALRSPQIGLAFWATVGAWLIPVRSAKGSIVNLRVWHPPGGTKRVREARMLNLTGLAAGLWNEDETARRIEAGCEEVWLCEGEWDGIAARWMVRQACRETAVAVCAVPGAGVFKAHWGQRLLRQRVRLWYDADAAGAKGAVRAAKMLDTYGCDVEVRRWGATARDVEGFDMRDYVRRWSHAPAMGYSRILKRTEVFDWRRGVEKAGKADKAAAAAAARAALPGGAVGASGGRQIAATVLADEIGWEAVVRAFRSHLQMTPKLETALWVACAVAAACRLRGPNPLWMFLVGPPGSGKTEILSAFDGIPEVEYVSNIGPKSLVSGFNVQGGDPSLLSRLAGRALVLKDFTEVRDMNANDQREVYSILRGAYDGRVDRMYGNGITRSYVGSWFSLLAGVTDAIHLDRQTASGERFLKLHLGAAGGQHEEAIAYRAMESMFTDAGRSVELRTAVGRFLWSKMRRIDDWVSAGTLARQLPVVSRAVLGEVFRLSRTVSLLRAEVMRDVRGEVSLSKPARENVARVSQQLLKLAVFLAYVRGGRAVGDAELEVVERVAWDSSYGWSSDLLRILRAVEVDAAEAVRGGVASQGTLVGLTSTEIARRLRVPRTAIYRRLEDAEMVGLVSRTIGEPGGGRPSAVWRLAKRLRSVMAGRETLSNGGVKPVRDRTLAWAKAAQRKRAVRRLHGDAKKGVSGVRVTKGIAVKST